MILDANAWFGHWHKQKFHLNTLGKLHKNLQSAGITAALISSTDAIFCSDPEPWNRELIRNLSKYPLFIPVPLFRPRLENREEIINYYSSMPVRALKFMPGYHAYSLISREIETVFSQCSEYKFVIFIQMRMEDERSHHPLVKIPPVKTDEVIRIARKFPALFFVCLSAYFSEAVLLCSKAENVYVDISFTECTNTVAALLKEIPASRVLFGSHTPFLYTESALLKIQYAETGQKEKDAILFKNACTLLNIDNDRLRRRTF